MSKLSETVADLSAIRRGLAHRSSDAGNDNSLQILTDFGTNPGNLAAGFHLPETWAEPRALVVVLHGCAQRAAAYDQSSGWSRLADDHGFALLYPKQRRANNANGCFNWFSSEDVARDSGEALSIRQMIATMVDAHGIDPARVFITGLSAGGAMTSVMLATYPELFAGGAIIAGIPYGIATNMSQGLDAMRGRGDHRGEDLAAHVRGASGHDGRWPTISVWHGTADTTVNVANADAIVAQWLPIHGIADDAAEQEMVAGHARRIWRDADGRPVIEDYRIAGMGHGAPLATSGEEACGAAGPYMLEAGLSSTRRIAAHWGLTAAMPAAVPADPSDDAAPAAEPARAPESVLSATTTGMHRLIEGTLRVAGLMR